MRITYSVATSRDGYIAREDGDVSWLEDLDIAVEDTGLAEFSSAVDGLIMGRKTYDFVFEHGQWPYEDRPSWVVTSQELETLEDANLKAACSVQDVVCQVKEQGLRNLWLLGGGQLASSFQEQRLITHLSISEMPVELGKGIPLFARHSRNHLPCAECRVHEKQGFRQIDMRLS